MKHPASVRVVDSIIEIDRGRWNSLVDDEIYLTHEWLKVTEESFVAGIEAKYFLLERGEELLGAAPCFVFHRTDLVETLDDLMFGRLKTLVSALGISLMPTFVCSPIYGYGQHILVKRDDAPEKRQAIVDTLVDRLHLAARDLALTVTFPHVSNSEQALCRALARRGFHRSRHVPLNYMRIRGDSFDEYRRGLKGISRNAMKSVKSEISKCGKAGVIIAELDDVGGHEACLHALLNENYLRHNRIPFMFKPEFFSRLRSEMPRESVLYVAMKGERIFGVCVMLRRKGAAHVAMVGIEGQISGGDCTYFNMTYYRPIRDAISGGTQRLYCGRGFYGLKARRGFLTEPLFIFYKASTPLGNRLVGPWLRVLSAWNLIKLPKRVRRMAASQPHDGELDRSGC